MLSIVYVRVSTETQEKRGYSIPEQIEAGKNKAISLGAKENEILVFVDSESGEFLNRTEFQKAIDTVENSNVDYFICLDPDRFSRKTVNALIAHEKIEKQGTEIVYCNNEYDKSPEGRLFLQMKMIIAEYEKEKIKVRTMMGKLGKAKRKLLTHNPNLYGYDYDPINDLLIINEEEAKIIIMIIRWVLDEKTTGMNKIANRLNSMGVLPPRGKKVDKKIYGTSYIKEEGKWAKASISRMLKNYTYTGTLFIQTVDTQGIKFNKFRKEEDKIKRKEKPREEWIAVQVPTIVPVEIWEEVQENLLERRNYKPGIAKEEYLLSGLLHCDKCKSTLHGNRVKKRNGNDHYKYYVCTCKSPGVFGKEKCDLPNINGDILDSTIWSLVKNWIINPKSIKEHISNNDNIDIIIREKDSLEKSITSLNEEKSKLDLLFMKSKINEKNYDKHEERIRKEINDLKLRLNEIASEIDFKKVRNKDVDNLEEYVNQYRDNLDMASFEEKKKLVNMFIYKISVLDKKKIDIKCNLPESWTKETTLWRVVTNVQN